MSTEAPKFNPQMTVLQRLHAVRQRVEYLKKEKRVEGYMAVTHDQVTDLLRDPLIEYGVLVLASVVPGTAKTVPTGTFTKNETPFIRVEAEYDVHFINVDDKSDREVVRVLTHALDHGDKAPGKALSYAVKAVELKAFNIVTGEIDDESRQEQKGKGGMSEEAFEAWRKKCDAVEDTARAEALWQDIASDCAKADDRQAAIMLRTYLSAIMTKKGIKSGQRKSKGGNGASTTSH
jgi:hypothetical protein